MNLQFSTRARSPRVAATGRDRIFREIWIGGASVPLYEYECSKCGRRFEKIEKVSAPLKQKCPKCGAVAVRLMSAPAIQFKGSGWYVTDYAGKSGGTHTDGKETGETKESKESKDTKEKKEPKPSKESGKKAHKEK